MLHTRRNKLFDYPEALVRAEELYKEGVGVERIAEIIKLEFGIQISRMSIWRYFEKRDDLAVGYIEQSPEAKEKVIQDFRDAIEQAKRANEVLWEIINKEDVKTSDKIAAVNSVLRQLENIEKKIAPVINPTKREENPIELAVKINRILSEPSFQRAFYENLIAEGRVSRKCPNCSHPLTYL